MLPPVTCFWLSHWSWSRVSRISVSEIKLNMSHCRWQGWVLSAHSLAAAKTMSICLSHCVLTPRLLPPPPTPPTVCFKVTKNMPAFRAWPDNLAWYGQQAGNNLFKSDTCICRSAHYHHFIAAIKCDHACTSKLKVQLLLYLGVSMSQDHVAVGGINSNTIGIKTFSQTSLQLNSNMTFLLTISMWNFHRKKASPLKYKMYISSCHYIDDTLQVRCPRNSVPSSLCLQLERTWQSITMPSNIHHNSILKRRTDHGSGRAETYIPKSYISQNLRGWVPHRGPYVHSTFSSMLNSDQAVHVAVLSCRCTGDHDGCSIDNNKNCCCWRQLKTPSETQAPHPSTDTCQTFPRTLAHRHGNFMCVLLVCELQDRRIQPPYTQTGAGRNTTPSLSRHITPGSGSRQEWRYHQRGKTSMAITHCQSTRQQVDHQSNRLVTQRMDKS